MATTWLLMDTQNRRIAPYPDFIAAWIARTERDEHLPAFGELMAERDQAHRALSAARTAQPEEAACS